ncbi:MAG: hypothetical protein KF787_02255 [Phycisphaeraceae bacterium]|nr:hypothetical protein [Phycisphaerae bacterium]MBX3391447.1 hypothetical protein [Phycisphaeraceae bacterium]HRJ50166.1 hypothetical protein [Phycisphaerales bacterium]
MRLSLTLLAVAGLASAAAASNNVLVWSTGNDYFGQTEAIAAWIQASGQFDSVTGINDDNALPLATLNAYDRVLYFSNHSDLQDPTAIGDVLADFADTGKRLVLAVFSWADQGGNTLGGRVISDEISPFTFINSSIYNEVALGATDGSAFWNGVNSLSAGYRDNVAITTGSTLHGSWSDGVPALASKGNVVGVNMFPDLAFGFYSGDAEQLFVNALIEVPAPGFAGLAFAGVIAAGRRRR